jgi:hypothetical protein
LGTGGGGAVDFGIPLDYGTPVAGLRASVPGETEEPEGIDLYDWLSMFRTLEQQQTYASPYAEGGMVQAFDLATMSLLEEYGMDPKLLARYLQDNR